MTWLLVAPVWMLLAFAVAGVVGRGIRLADERLVSNAWTEEIDAFLQRHSPEAITQPAAAPQVQLP
jgi:hypothetical protein